MSNAPAVKRKRRYQTTWSVRAADRISSALITTGGIGTILAVSAVCLFLLSVVVPLFLPGEQRAEPVTPAPSLASTPIQIGTDENQTVVWSLLADGTLTVNRLGSGERIHRERLFSGKLPTAWAIDEQRAAFAAGFDDGTVRLGSVGFTIDYPDPDALGLDPASLDTDGAVVVENTVITVTPEGQLRRSTVSVEVGSAFALSDSGSAIRLLDYVATETRPAVATLTADAELSISYLRSFENLMTGEIVTEVNRVPLPDPLVSRGGTDRIWPAHLHLNESASMLLAVWTDGIAVRYDTRRSQTPAVAERLAMLGRDEMQLTALQPLIGRSTVLAGGSDGKVRLWFPYVSSDSRTPDLVTFAQAEGFEGTGVPVTTLAASLRSRVFAVGYEDGRVNVHQATTNARILSLDTGDDAPVLELCMTPKNDGVVALVEGGVHHWRIDIRHPEATMAALFTPVWYEGYPAPAHVWQSSSGTDDFEPKFGLWPLVFGTLKATFYSMLFGVPLALLAAIFSSEFLHPVIRTRVKTIIEFMASLPSVVLGFLAALIFAPFVQAVVPTVIVGFFAVPGAFLLGSYFWQLLPHDVSLRLERMRLVFLCATLPVGMFVAVWLGPAIERLLFVGNLRAWLDGNVGSAAGGWLLLFLPVAGLLTGLMMARVVMPWFRGYIAGMSRRTIALLDLARFGVALAATLLFALVAAGFLTGLGLDPRGSRDFLDTYVQRNAMIVGFIMGFAIIPIIYTIAEDALSAVPEHLRAASLGAGATPWQTAVRIVIPAAMSGLFSAIMIGLGRAVGETMIVLMAAGNTPILDINIFNGFRTLSANIAVELPEAVRNSTHYRTLFLAALILFAMTFLINTVAEVVRLRFRKRASQL